MKGAVGAVRVQKTDNVSRLKADDPDEEAKNSSSYSSEDSDSDNEEERKEPPVAEVADE